MKSEGRFRSDLLLKSISYNEPNSKEMPEWALKIMRVIIMRKGLTEVDYFDEEDIIAPI